MKSLFKSKTALFFLSLSISLSVLLGFSLYYNFTVERPIKVVDLNMLTRDQALAWASDNEIKLEILEAYDESIVSGTVINQSTNVGERIFAGSTITVTLSKGPDPEVLVDLIDFKGKDIGDVQTFIDSSKLMNATIKFEKSEDISSAFFIRQSIASGQIKRSDKIDFFISTGDKDTLTTVIVPDFSTYTRQQVSSWGTSSNIKVNFIEEFNKDFEQGKIFEQSKTPNTSVYDGSSVTVKISLGTGVVLENFVGKSKSAIDTFINANGLKVTYEYTFSSQQNKDYGISMSPAAAVRVAANSSVKVVLSLGKITVTNFTGKTLSQLQTWISEQNKNGANLKLSSSQAYSDSVTSGQLISQTPSSGDINPGTEIKASVSKGGGVIVKNFIGGTSTSQEGLKISTSNTYHSSTPSGQVISQSITSGTRVDSNTSINLVVSLGKVQVGSYNTLADLENWKNSVNGDGANISISTTSEWNDKTAGLLVSHSNANTSVSPGTTISAVISKGPSVSVQNYVQLNNRDQDGLSESYEEVNNAAAAGTVIGQSISAGDVVARGTGIKITISKGPVLVERKTVPPASSFLSGREIGSVADAEGYIRSGMSLNGFTNVSFSTTTVACSYIGEVKGQTPNALTENVEVTTMISVTLCSTGG